MTNGDVTSGDSARPVVAAFDFDGTLTRSDTVVPFLRIVSGRRRLETRLLRRVVSVVPAAARRDRDELRLIATQAVFCGVPISEVESLAGDYARTIADSRLRPDVLGRLQWHLEQGHQVVIVSASYEQYVHAVAGRIGAHGAVATRLDVDAAGLCTGRLAGENCRAGEKVRRLDEWLAERGLTRLGLDLWAYGDSSGDRELLEAANHPVWVSDTLDSVAPTSA